MTEPLSQNPRDSVFTTVVWDHGEHLADLDAHLHRMEEHARRLRIAWPDNMRSEIERVWKETIEPKEVPGTMSPRGLIRIEWSRIGELSIEPREVSFRNEGVEAITLPAPRWSPRINGTKHGDWEPYVEAMKEADSKGADLALLVHNFAIVDADRATPLVFDEDGTAWISEATEGGVESVTVDVLIPLLHAEGIPVNRGRLNERLVARALEMSAIGSGIGAARIEAIDGERIGSENGLTEKCQSLLSQHYQNKNTWSHVGA